MKICLLGAQGTGKSTLLNKFRKDYNVIDGIARNVLNTGGSGNETGTVSSQRRIFEDYYKAVTENDNFISTRSIIDVVAYTQYLCIHEKSWFRKIRLNQEYRRQLKITKAWIEDNPDVVICFIPVEFGLENDGVRSINPEYQREISKLMSDLFWGLSIKQRWIISGDVDTRVKQLKDIIEILILKH